jgi:nitrate/TMAO reductase-like tetraheme cytochrome c subunit
VSRPGTLVRHPLAIAGTLITAISGAVFLALLAAALIGLFDNPYAGLVVFVAVPAVLVLGMILVPAGMWLQRRKLARHPDTANEWPVWDFGVARVRRVVLLFAAFATLVAAIALVAGYGSLHYMESPTFCGQACHTPMQVQYTAWQAGPHARIACVNCHVGEGARGMVQAKLAGTRQLVHVITGSIPRPIPPGAQVPFGGHDLTCGRCHQPMKIPGDVIRVTREYADDDKSTETMTVLLMHVGRANATGRAIHWHADPSTSIDFASSDAARQTISYVKVTSPDGTVKEYFAEGAANTPGQAESLRRMDCVDCHNMVGHRIATAPEQAVDRAIADGAVSRALPFARREAVRVLKTSYANGDEASRRIDEELRRFYSAQSGTIDPQALGRAISALQDAYSRNVFPTMKVSWGSYPDNTGHIASPGCFRCHDGSHTAKDGTTISSDCEYCHKQAERPTIPDP